MPSGNDNTPDYVPDEDGECPSQAHTVAILRRFDELTQASFHVIAAESGTSPEAVYDLLVECGVVSAEPEAVH